MQNVLAAQARVPSVPPHKTYTSRERARYMTIIEDDGSKQDYMLGSRLSDQPMSENYCQLKDLPTEQEVSSSGARQRITPPLNLSTGRSMIYG